ncbi:uncharacterized protein [Amphiura filiformis]|uniref:uncharacterized protein n=1 Tax=Amphiura filiformis TaxID=82378 RepID=UPI003B225987
MPRHQRQLSLSRDWCTAGQLSGVLLVILVVFIAPSSQEELDLYEYCTSRYFILPTYLRIACEHWLSKDISPGNTDSNTGTTTSGDGQRRPMTDPPRYGKRSGSPFPFLQNSFTSTKRVKRQFRDTSLLTNDNVILESQTSFKVSIRKILRAALARALVRRLTDNAIDTSYTEQIKNLTEYLS